MMNGRTVILQTDHRPLSIYGSIKGITKYTSDHLQHRETLLLKCDFYNRIYTMKRIRTCGLAVLSYSQV